MRKIICKLKIAKQKEEQFDDLNCNIEVQSFQNARDCKYLFQLPQFKYNKMETQEETKVMRKSQVEKVFFS